MHERCRCVAPSRKAQSSHSLSLPRVCIFCGDLFTPFGKRKKWMVFRFLHHKGHQFILTFFHQRTEVFISFFFSFFRKRTWLIYVWVVGRREKGGMWGQAAPFPLPPTRLVSPRSRQVGQQESLSPKLKWNKCTKTLERKMIILNCNNNEFCSRFLWLITFPLVNNMVHNDRRNIVGSVALASVN